MGGLEKVGGGEGGAKLPQPRIDVVHVSCTRYGDVHEVSEALGPGWR